jgi:hypothetical protein
MQYTFVVKQSPFVETARPGVSGGVRIQGRLNARSISTVVNVITDMLRAVPGRYTIHIQTASTSGKGIKPRRALIPVWGNPTVNVIDARYLDPWEQL